MKEKYFRKTDLLGGAIALTLFAAGCNGNTEAQSPSQPENITPNSAYIMTATPESFGALRRLTQEELDRATQISAANVTNVLGIDLHKAGNICNKTHLVSSEDELREILNNNNEGLAPEIIDYLAITIPGNNGVKEIYAYGPNMDNTMKQIPNTPQEDATRIQFEEYVVDHELIHCSSQTYKSHVLFDLIYKKMGADFPAFKGKTIEEGFVDGARVLSTLDGKKITAYKQLEEAEAYLISNYAIVGSKEKKYLANLEPKVMGIETQVDMLYDFLKIIGNNNPENAIKTLANLRTQTGGREQWAEIIAEKLGAPQDENRLFFSMSLLLAINNGDRQMYDFYINLYRQTVPPGNTNN